MMQRLKGFVLSLFIQTNERNCLGNKSLGRQRKERRRGGGGREGRGEGEKGRRGRKEGEGRGGAEEGKGFLRMDTGMRPCLVGAGVKTPSRWAVRCVGQATFYKLHLFICVAMPNSLLDSHYKYFKQLKLSYHMIFLVNNYFATATTQLLFPKVIPKERLMLTKGRSSFWKQEKHIRSKTKKELAIRNFNTQSESFLWSIFH